MTNHFEQISSAFGPEIVTLAAEAYLEEPRGRYASPSVPLVRPRTTQEVASVVRYCFDNGISIVPYAGGTGLVGGQVKEDGDAIILSVERMNKLRGVYPDENVMIVEAGMVLADVQAAAEAADRLFPLSLAAEGSCRIGGNLATNAGGVQVLRYGNARDLCLGIEAVMPDGSIHHGLKRLRKDNTGYDLRNLLIGSEGSLGIITAAALKLFPKPKEVMTAFLAVRSPKDAISLLTDLQGKMDGALSAFELIHKQGLSFLAETMPQVRLPFDPVPEWMVLLEATTGEGSQISDRAEVALGYAYEQGWVTDAIIAQSDQQRDGFWEVRESIPEANRLIGSLSNHDISLPISAVPEFIAHMPAILEKIDQMRINCFGHLGDGNLHYNLFPPVGKTRQDMMVQRDSVKIAIHDQVHKLGGSISAEHGIGRLKTSDLEKYGDPTKLNAMRAIKAALDPKGIMNPGAVVPK